MIKHILDWLEVWAILIPLFVFILCKPKEGYLHLIFMYLIIALCLNIVSDISWKFRTDMPSFLKENGFLYNISSIARFFFFILFFRKIDMTRNKNYNFILFPFLIIAVIYFIITGEFEKISSPLLATEAIVLLFFCIAYFIRLIKADEVFLSFDPSLIVVAGLAIFESVNFFVFLFYSYLIDSDCDFASAIWHVSNIAFLILCLFIARSFLGRLNEQRI